LRLPKKSEIISFLTKGKTIVVSPINEISEKYGKNGLGKQQI
jgi:hypothetical protein